MLEVINQGPSYVPSKFYSWVGEGCTPTNAFCQFNSPPWFFTTFTEPTTDDIELRICHDEPLVDKYVMQKANQ